MKPYIDMINVDYILVEWQPIEYVQVVGWEY